MVDQLKRFLEQNYHFGIDAIAPGPRQWVAETYIIHSRDRNRFFVKLFRNGRLPHFMIGSLPVLAELHSRGIAQVNYPIATTTGALYTQSDAYTVVVFNYINAIQTSDYDVHKLGDLIAQIHQQTGKITAPIRQEAFDPPYRVALQESLACAWEQRRPDSSVLALRQFLTQYKDEIAQDWSDFENIGRRCRQSQFDLLLTHSDAPGNVLKDTNDTIYLVDCDEILLAPAERDTWFLISSPQFMQGYRTRFPTYTSNDAAYRFYLYNRYFEDLLGYVVETLGDYPIEHRAVRLQELQHTCVAWLRPQLRALT